MNVTALIDLGFLMVLALVALLVGLGGLRLARIRFADSLEAFSLSLGLGLGLLGFGVLLAGSLGFARASLPVSFLLVTLALVGLRSRSTLRPVCSRSTWTVLCWLPLPALALLLALAPPVSNDWDSLTYHLAMPKLWLRAGRLAEVPWCDHSYFPALMEMLYLLGLPISPSAAKLPHFLTFVLALSTIVLIGRTYFSRAAGLAGAVVFASVPMVLHEATTAYVDIALAAYTLLAMYCLLQWLTSSTWSEDAHPPLLSAHQSPLTSHHYLPLAGVFAGIAMSIKYTGLLIFGLLSAWVAIAWWRGRSWRTPPRASLTTVLLFAALACAIASPWYVKNVVQTGNPVYPFFYGVFGGRGYTQRMADQYRHHQREFGYDRTPTNLLASPWRISMWPWHLTNSLEFILTNPGNHRRLFETTVALPTLGLIGPLLLALLVPLCWSGSDRSHEQKLVLQVLLGSAGALGLVWFALEQYNRYLFPAVALLSVAAGLSAGELMTRHRLVRGIIVAALAWSSLVGAWLLMRFHGEAVPVALGQKSRRDYLFRMPLYPACDFINQEAPAHARVLLLGEERGFYLDRDYLWGNPGHHTLLPYERMHSAADWHRELRRLKVTHLLVHVTMISAEGLRWIEQGEREGHWRARYDTRKWDEVLRRWRGYVVFELTERDG